MKYVVDDETGEKCVSLPVDDFEELVEQLLDWPELEKSLKDDRAVVSLADVRRELELD